MYRITERFTGMKWTCATKAEAQEITEELQRDRREYSLDYISRADFEKSEDAIKRNRITRNGIYGD